MYKLLKPLSVSSILWALLVTAVVLLVATSANAQTAPQSTEIVPPSAPVPVTPTATSSPSTLPPVPQPRNVEQPMLPPASDTNETASSTVTTTTLVEMQTQRSDMLAERLAEVNERRAAIEQKKTTLQNASSTRRSVLPLAAQQQAATGMTRVKSILTTSISKSRDFAERLSSHVITLEGRGVDVSSTLVYIDQAEEQLNLAEQALQDIDINAQYAITSATPRTDWQDVQEQFSVVRAALKEAHSALRSGTVTVRGLFASNPSAETESELTPSEQ